jgi:VanZ family protein
MEERIVYGLFAIVLLALTVLGVVRAVRASIVRTPLTRPTWAVAAVLVWLVALVFMTVRPGNGRGVRLNLIPIVVDGPGSALDAILNILVFVPPGLLLATIGWTLLRTIAAALATSLAIEVAQYVTDWGRTADVNDLITNVSGAALGWVIAWAIMRVGGRPSRPVPPSSPESFSPEAPDRQRDTLER